MLTKDKKDEVNPEQVTQNINSDEKSKEVENIISVDSTLNANAEVTQPLPTTEKTAEMKKKIRCKKWPLCKNESCEYSHPKETVSLI